MVSEQELQDWQSKLDQIKTNVEYLELFKPNKDHILSNVNLRDIFVEKKAEVLQDTYIKYLNNQKNL